MERYFPLRRTDLVLFSLEHILLDKMLKDHGKVAVSSAVIRQSRTGSNCGTLFCIQCIVDSKGSQPSCSFSWLKELGPIHTGKKCQMEQEISDFKFPEKRTTSRGAPKFSKRFSGNFLFHWILNRDFRKFWSNGTRPVSALNLARELVN